jgi:hypothetical protein
MAVFTFLITLSFFLTTPLVSAPIGFPAISGNVGQFLLKDAGLLRISIWLLGDALIATAPPPRGQVNCRGLLEGASDERRDGMRKTAKYCGSFYRAVVSSV